MSVGSDQYTVQCQFSRGRWASFATAIGIFVHKVAALPKMCNVYQSATHNNFDPQIFSRVGQRPWKAKECDTSCYLQRCWPRSVTLACRHTSCFYNYQDELAVCTNAAVDELGKRVHEIGPAFAPIVETVIETTETKEKIKCTRTLSARLSSSRPL